MLSSETLVYDIPDETQNSSGTLENSSTSFEINFAPNDSLEPLLATVSSSNNLSLDVVEASGPEPKRRRLGDGDGHLRCPNYTDEENFLIAHLFKEHQEILRDHRNTTKINRLKNAIWQLIADTISSRPGATTRTAEQVGIKVLLI